MKRLLALATELHRIDMSWRIGLYALIGATLVHAWIPPGGGEARHVVVARSVPAPQYSAPVAPVKSDARPADLGITYGALGERVEQKIQGRPDAHIRIDNSSVEGAHIRKSADEEILRLLEGD